MIVVAGRQAVAAVWNSPSRVAPMQVVDPTAVVGLPAAVRAAAAFGLVLLLGGAIVWRFEPFLARSIDASMERPIASVGYGLAAHAVIVFAGVYLGSQLASLPTGTWNAGVVGVALGSLVVLGAAALGFTVVGSTVADLWLGGRPWAGPVVGATLAGGAAAADPVVGGLLWFLVVSTGIGGPARRWLHASEGPPPADVRRE